MFRKIIAALTLSLAFVYSASAATFNVNTTNDTVDANTGNNVCADANGKCSLRAAVMQANNTAGSDKINLPAGTYKLSLVGANEDLSATGDLDVNETLTVVGVDPNTTIIDGVLSDRIFDVHPMIGTPAFKLQNVHLTKGTYASGSGGAILHQSTGQVTLLNSKFSKNSASSIGVLYTLGPVTIQDSIFEDNTASSNVGVLYKTGAGDLLIDSSRFESNKTSGGIAVIYNVGGSDLTKITDSEFINNQASSTGGVLYQATNGPLAISGTTISGNISSGFTGIYCSNPATSLTIEDSEFLNNLSISGGIITCQFSTVARIKNSTFSDNTTFSGSGTIALQGSGVSSDLIIEDSNFVSNAMISGVGGVLAANLSGSMRISR